MQNDDNSPGQAAFYIEAIDDQSDPLDNMADVHRVKFRELVDDLRVSPDSTQLNQRIGRAEGYAEALVDSRLIDERRRAQLLAEIIRAAVDRQGNLAS